MERLISLFREADYDQWSPGRPQPPPKAQPEPLYFQQLLAYLREQRDDADSGGGEKIRRRQSGASAPVAAGA